MIDYQPEIYTRVYDYMKAKIPGLYVTGDVSLSPAQQGSQIKDTAKAKIPCLLIEETDNVDIELDNSGKARYAKLQYTLSAFSNKQGGRISEARQILSVADEVMQQLNFRRTSFLAQSGLYNNSVYKITATYSVAIGEDGTLYIR